MYVRAEHGSRHGSGKPRVGSAGAFDRGRELDARGHVELAEDVAQVSFDGFLLRQSSLVSWGAWLGFAVTEGFGAVFTGVVGAIVGANLALVVLDASRGRSRHVALAPASDVPVRAASPSDVLGDAPGDAPSDAPSEGDLVPAGSTSHVDPA